MKLYRVHIVDKRLKSQGYQFTTNEAAARALTHDLPKGSEAQIEKLEIPLTKNGLLDALRRYASHPNN